MTEVLFTALLLTVCDIPDGELWQWAQQVAANKPRAEALGVSWQPLTTDEHRTRGFKGKKRQFTALGASQVCIHEESMGENDDRSETAPPRAPDRVRGNTDNVIHMVE